MKTKYIISALVFDKDGICIGQGQNNYSKSHPLQAYFAKKVGKPDQIYLHAEIHAILKARERKIHSINIYRYNALGHPKNAKPCPICIEAIKAFGIQSINYTTDKGFIYGKTVEELKNEYRSDYTND